MIHNLISSHLIFLHMPFDLFPPNISKVLRNMHLLKTLAIFPWPNNSVSESINLICLKMMPNLVVIKSFSSATVLTVPDWAKLVKYCCNNLSDLALSPSVLLNDNASSTKPAGTFWTWTCSTEWEAAWLLPPPWTLAWSVITCGDELLGEEAGEVVCETRF